MSGAKTPAPLRTRGRSATKGRSRLANLRRELDEIAKLKPEEIAARLDLPAATRRFRDVLSPEFTSEAEDVAKRYGEMWESWADGLVDSDDDLLAEKSQSFNLTGAIKWFDASKGYGFIVPDNGTADIVLHISCVRISGYSSVLLGARVDCQVARRANALQVIRFRYLDALPTPRPVSRSAITRVPIIPESDWERATVKWFNRVRGFGYLSQDDGRSDIFILAETASLYGFSDLLSGQVVQVRWGVGAEGRTVAEIRADEPSLLRDRVQ